ncbi:MAG: hypothetical protein LBL82_02135 [Oscillospiraceae bacterium]|nr:hypothetical protein [Oscillospiraceae bacterium]
MKKSNFREYSASAFRFYSMCGCPEWREVASSSPRNAYMSDLVAAGKTIEQLSDEPNGGDIINCVREIYYFSSFESQKKGNTSMKVRYVSTKYAMSEATVYRYLSKACLLFAKNRELRIDGEEDGLPKMWG